MEKNWDTQGWNASGTYPSIRMEPGRKYRFGGQTYAHDGWPIDDEPRGTAPASSRRAEPTPRRDEAPEPRRRRSPTPEDQYVEPHGPADEGRVPPGVGLPPRARYYDNDSDDYLRPCSRYPYEDEYNRDRGYRGSSYDEDYSPRRTNTPRDYSARGSTYRDEDYDRDYRGSYGRGDRYDRDHPDEDEYYDDGRERRSSQRDDRYYEDDDEDRGSRGYRTLSIYRVRGF